MRSFPVTARWVVAAVLACTMAGVRGARAGPDDGPTAARVKLTGAVLSAPEAVLVRPDAQGVRVSDGRVLAGAIIQLESQQDTKDHLLAGSNVRFSIADAQTLKLLCAGRSITLQRDQMSFKPVKLTIGPGRSYTLAFPYGYVFQYQQEPGQMQTRGFAMLRSGSAQYFSLDGQSFCIYDANTDGYYRVGEDAIGSGRSGGPFAVYAPLGRLLATGKAVYQVRNLAEDGSELQYTRYAGPTAKLSLAVEGTDLEIGSAVGSSDAGLNLAATVGTQAQQMCVVPGRYNLLYGLAYSPKLKKLVASVGPGKLAGMELAADQSQTLTLGGPFRFEFELQTAGRQLTIQSSTFHLFGKNGEEYANFAWAAEPEISLVAGGKTTALGKMQFG